MATSARALCVLVVAIVGCAGRYGGPGPGRPAGSKVGIEAAALPYQVLDRSGHQTEEAAFWSRAARARAVCVGEEHPNPHHHWVQLHVVRELARRYDKRDKLALGLEMFQRPFQAVVDDYAARRIDADALRSRSGWAERWGYDWGFYGPTIDAAIDAGGQLLALNAPRELTKKVVRHGLESLTPDEKAQVPELDLEDARHRAWFDALMEGMGGTSAHSQKPRDGKDEPGKTSADAEPVESPHAPGGGGGGGEPTAMPSAERVYTVQVLWDETMADGGARWLAAHPNGHLIILAGNGHCHDSAIVGRIKRRGVADVISVRAIIDDGGGAVAEVLAKPINDYVVVMQLPKSPDQAVADGHGK